MSSFTIPPCSSLSLSNVHQYSRLCFNRSSNFVFKARRTSLRCSNNTGGENENRSVLDAFFLGKALAEVINERIESTVGEVLGTIGKFQAEQQKQVQQIQEEVLERAKRAKDRAARDTMEAQGLVASKPTTINQNPAAGVAPTSIVERNTIISNENLSAFSGSSSVGDVVESSSSSDDDSV